MKNKQILTFATILVIGFLAGTFFTKDDQVKKITNFFGGGNNLSATLDNSFRTLSSREQIKILREVGKTEGSGMVLSTLRRIYPDEPADEHELAHIVGEAAYMEDGYAGFGACDSFMRFACYHGVVLEAIKQNGRDQQVLDNLAQGCLELERNKTTITACVHGVGHGLMVINSYELLPSYEDCDSMFNDGPDAFFCYDGVSMENVVRRQEQADAQNFLESNDPYYPCNTVAEKYQPACVREHLHHSRLTFYEKDTLKSQDYCLYFKYEPSRRECFGAIGNALNQEFFSQPEKVITECKKIIAGYRENCFGVAATQYAFGRQFDKAEMICSAMDDESKKVQCMGAVEYAKASLN